MRSHFFKSSSLAILLSIVALLAFPTVRALAFVFASEEEQFEADLSEAKARAQDFRKYLERVQRAKVERDSASEEASIARKKYEEEMEKRRREYVKSAPDYEQIQRERDRLEREWEREKEAKEKEMEAARRQYVRNRMRIREALKREAYINEADEYDLHWRGNDLSEDSTDTR